MTLTFVLCNLPITWTLPRAWRERKTLDGQRRHRPVALAAVGGDLGRGRPALLRPLLHPAVATAVPPRRRASLVRSSRRVFDATVAAALLHRGRRCSAAGFFMRPFDEGAEYKPVSAVPRQRIQPLDRIFVWGQRAGDLLGVGRPARRRGSSRRRCSPATTRPNRPSPRSRRATCARRRARPSCGSTFYEDFARTRPRYILDTHPPRIRGSEDFPISRYPEPRARSSTATTHYMTYDRRHRRLRAQGRRTAPVVPPEYRTAAP